MELCCSDRVLKFLVPIVLIPAVLIDKHFALRALLFSKCALLCPLDGSESNDKLCILSIDLIVGVCSDAESFKVEICGDSGDELGEGSVRLESNVEIVVVGEDSADSVVAEEPLLVWDDMGVISFDIPGWRDLEESGKDAELILAF